MWMLVRVGGALFWLTCYSYYHSTGSPGISVHVMWSQMSMCLGCACIMWPVTCLCSIHHCIWSGPIPRPAPPAGVCWHPLVHVHIYHMHCFIVTTVSGEGIFLSKYQWYIQQYKNGYLMSILGRRDNTGTGTGVHTQQVYIIMYTTWGGSVFKYTIIQMASQWT